MRQLRASGQKSGNNYDLAAAIGQTDGDGGVPGGQILRDFADAIVGNDSGRLFATQKSCSAALGDAGMVDAAAIAAQFDALDRVADATGMYLDDTTLDDTAEIRATLGIDAFVRPAPEPRRLDRLHYATGLFSKYSMSAGVACHSGLLGQPIMRGAMSTP